MKKIICIGECSLNIILGPDGSPQGSMPGGRIVNAAAILARAGLLVVMASEAAADSVGQIVVDFIAAAGADIASVDRFTEGRTPMNVFTAESSGNLRLNRYEQYPPQDGFDIVWPRVEEGDIVVFGGYYAIDARIRPRLTKFLDHAAEMKAVMVYLPGFLPEQEPRITRVMPALLENLELADIVITRNDDLRLIFGVDDDTTCYRNHIGFYCRSLVNVDAACRRISYFGGNEMTSAEIPDTICRSLMWNAGALAGVVEALVAADAGRDALMAPDAPVREEILRHAVGAARRAAAGLTAPWQQCP